MSSFHPISQFIDHLREFVRGEFVTQRRKFEEQRALPLLDRVDKGSCLAGLRFSHRETGGQLVFGHSGNDSRLREGDFVRLSHATELLPTFPLMIFREEPDQLWLSGENGLSTDVFVQNLSDWVLDEDFFDLEKFYLEALEKLGGTEIGQQCVLPLFLGNAAEGFDADEFGGIMDEFEQSGGKDWEDAQQEAIAGCLAAGQCYLVQGPPGTGKTRVLAEVVRRLVERGERVLITGFTHRSIDNALEAAAKALQDRSRIGRFAAATHRRAESFDSYEYFIKSPLHGLAGGWVAAATPFALRKRLAGVEFDAVIFDESGQMTTPLAIMAMLTARKYLFFGDQKQLAPVAASLNRRDAATMGVFHALKSRELDGTMLDVTYRLNEELTHWPSENFYHGKLRSAPLAAQRRLACRLAADLPTWTAQALDPECSVVWIEHSHVMAKTSSRPERQLAGDLLVALHDGGVPLEEIAIVTPYRRQARRLRNHLQQRRPQWNLRTVVIDTVDRMQGQEREVILISLCASDPMFIRMHAEFLFDPARLNVSATRAKTKLIILASENLALFDCFDSDLEEDVELLRSLRRSARFIRLKEGSAE